MQSLFLQAHAVALSQGHFATLDWVVLGAYLVVLVVTGCVFTRRSKTTDEYFRASGHMPAWAVAASILATGLSAATFIGVPEIAFQGDLSYLATTFSGVLAVAIVAVVIVPACYQRHVMTVYELLDDRYGAVTRRAAGLMYMLGRTLAIGARGYIGALPMSMMIWGDLAGHHVALCVVALTAAGVAYTIVGGIGTVIWTDVVQTVVFVGAGLVAIWLLYRHIGVGVDRLVDVLNSDGKLQVIDASFEPGKSFSIWSVLVGFTLLQLGSYGTDQDMVQRMLTCKHAMAGSRSALMGIVLWIPVTLMFLGIGLLLYVYYDRPDVMGTSGPGYGIDDTRKVFLTFILREMPAGLTGLMMAGLFAAGLSSVNSTLNAMSATLIEDFYKPWRQEKSESHYVAMGRLAVVLWGVAIGAVGCLSIVWSQSEHSSLLDFALGVMAYAYAGLVAVFISALCTRRGCAVSALAAFVTGILVVTILQPGVWGSLTRLVIGHALAMPLAWTWRFVIATVLAFGVCQLGSQRSSE